MDPSLVYRSQFELYNMRMLKTFVLGLLNDIFIQRMGTKNIQVLQTPARKLYFLN